MMVFYDSKSHIYIYNYIYMCVYVHIYILYIYIVYIYIDVSYCRKILIIIPKRCRSALNTLPRLGDFGRNVQEIAPISGGKETKVYCKLSLQRVHGSKPNFGVWWLWLLHIAKWCGEITSMLFLRKP
jgi:hypothetical protein